MFTEQQQNLITKIVLETATGQDFLEVSTSFDYLRFFFLDGDVNDTLQSFDLKVVTKREYILIRDNAIGTHIERYFLYTPAGEDILDHIQHRGETIYPV